MDFKIISSTNFEPMQNFIVVELYDSAKDTKKAEEVTDSGLVLSLAKEKSVVNDRPVYGKVQKVGPDCKTIIPGMEIFWDITRGQDISFKNGEYILLYEEAVLGYRSAEES